MHPVGQGCDATLFWGLRVREGPAFELRATVNLKRVSTVVAILLVAGALGALAGLIGAGRSPHVSRRGSLPAPVELAAASEALSPAEFGRAPVAPNPEEFIAGRRYVDTLGTVPPGAINRPGGSGQHLRFGIRKSTPRVLSASSWAVPGGANSSKSSLSPRCPAGALGSWCPISPWSTS
jgi:hypothetical protein